MEFSFDKFYQINRRILTWVLFFLLIWALRDFFGVIFLTFVISFIAQPMIHYAQNRLRLPRRVAIVVVYLLFLLGFISIVIVVTPRVVDQATLMIGNLPKLEKRLLAVKDDLIHKYPELEGAIPGYLASALSEGGADSPLDFNYRAYFEQQSQLLINRLQLTDPLDMTREEILLMRDAIPSTATQTLAELARYDRERDELLIRTLLNQQLDLFRSRMPEIGSRVYAASLTLLLALFFSFLVMIDIARLGREVKSLGSSRLRDFYNQTAQPVVRFAYVIGRAIRAQAMIAIVNTVLTIIGLWGLGIPSIVMLSFIVFFCSFIPVLGVFISTTPIVLIAFNSGGVGLALGVVIMVVLIHLVEAYLLNPLIYGQHFKINPVLVLIILFVGHHMFGIWGMVLGVPVAYYFIHDVFGVPVWDESRLADDAGRIGGVSAEPEPIPIAEDEAFMQPPYGDTMLAGPDDDLQE